MGASGVRGLCTHLDETPPQGGHGEHQATIGNQGKAVVWHGNIENGVVPRFSFSGMAGRRRYQMSRCPIPLEDDLLAESSQFGTPRPTQMDIPGRHRT